MKKYSVILEVPISAYTTVEIEAGDEVEAEEIAHERCRGGDFDRDFEITDYSPRNAEVTLVELIE